MTNDLTTRIKTGSTNLIPALGESVTHRVPETLLFGKIGPYHSAVFFKSHARKEVMVHFSVSICVDGFKYSASFFSLLFGPKIYSSSTFI
jgi:hypothetical protein